ncbi:MAG: hypothetical protein HOC20_12955 [Chloroflexi bacterium]|nr:hypothetical protein [Chloroflexota bacterium]
MTNLAVGSSIEAINCKSKGIGVSVGLGVGVYVGLGVGVTVGVGVPGITIGVGVPGVTLGVGIIVSVGVGVIGGGVESLFELQPVRRAVLIDAITVIAVKAVWRQRFMGRL